MQAVGLRMLLYKKKIAKIEIFCAALHQVAVHNHQVGTISLLNSNMRVCFNIWARLAACSVYRHLLKYMYRAPSYYNKPVFCRATSSFSRSLRH